MTSVNSNNKSSHVASNFAAIDLFADTAAILISIVSKDIMGCSGGKLICICRLGIP